MKVPWTESQGRFTRLFERFAVEVLLASASVSQGCELLGIGWETAHEIMRRAVERGLERRQLEDSSAWAWMRRALDGGNPTSHC